MADLPPPVPGGSPQDPTQGASPDATKADAASQNSPPAHPPLHDDEGSTLVCPEGARSRWVSGGSPLPEGVDAHFGDYVLLEVVARGGMGVVYKAREKKLDRIVALKMILVGHMASPVEVQRFHYEAGAAARLDHPGIVPIFAIGNLNGTHYYSMAYIEGGSLAARIRDKPLPPHEAGALVEQVARAVEYAHQQGIIHRDLKPSNVLLDKNGQPKVSDFGLAKRLASDNALTISGQVVGTPSYMSPEQAAGKTEEIGPAADIYSLGALLYSLMTSRPPFHSANSVDTLKQVMEQEPVSPRYLNTAISRDLETICLKCLQKEPARRYGSAAALADDLRRWLAGKPIDARPVGSVERMWRWCRRNPVVANLVGAVFITLVVGIIFTSYFAFRARRGEAKAVENEWLAEQRAELNELSAYVAKINSIHRAWKESQVEWVENELLALHPGAQRWQSFEYHYLQKLCRLDLRTVPAHQGGIGGIAHSPDGRYVASAGEDGTVKIWDAATGQWIRTLPGSGKRWGVVFSPDGRYLAACGGRIVTVWDPTSGKEIRTLPPHTSGCEGVAFTPNQQLVTTDGGFIKIWDPVTGEKFREFSVRGKRVWSVCVSPDGRRLAAGTGPNAFPGSPLDTELRIWDMASGEELPALSGHTQPIVAVRFSPNGRWLASASVDRTVRLWDADSGKRSLVLSGTGYFHSIVFSPDGSQLAATAGNGDYSARIWDVSQGTEVLTLRGHQGSVFSASFSPDGRSLVTGSADTTIKFWDATQSRETINLSGNGGSVVGVEFIPGQRRVISVDRDGMLKIWDIDTRKALVTRKAHNENANVALTRSRDGRLFATASTDQTVKVWSTQDGSLLRAWEGGHGPGLCIALRGDGAELASVCLDGTIQVWDVATGKAKRTLAGKDPSCACLAWSADGSRIASADKDYNVIIWDAQSGATISTLRGHQAQVACLAFSDDGLSLASGGYDKALIVWDLATGTLRRTIPHLCAVTTVAFSPDNLRIASCSGTDAHEVTIWDATTGQETITLHPGALLVQALGFSGDCKQLICAIGSRIVIWDASVSEPPRTHSIMRLEQVHRQ